jgi:tetratricopeptide (TPR) repeat protein
MKVAMLLVIALFLTLTQPDIRSLILEQRYEEALQLLDAIPLIERDLDAHLMVSQSALGLQQYDRAIEALHLARGKAPDNLNIQLQLARTYRASGQPELAKAVGESILQRDPSHRQVLILLGAIHMEEDNWSASRRMYEELVRQDTTNTSFRYALSRVYSALDLKSESLFQLLAARKLSPNHLGVLHDLTRVYYELDLLNEAMDVAEFAMNLYPTNIPIRKRIGEIEFKRQKYAEAAVQYKEVIGLGEETATAWRNLGMCLYFAEDYGPARDALTQSLAKESQDPNTNFYMAMALIQSDEAELALPLIDSTIVNSMGTLLVDGYIQKGVQLDQQKRMNEAVEAYSMAYALAPKRHEILYFTAAAYDRSGRNRTEARDYYNRYLRSPGEKDETMANYARRRVSVLTEEIHFRN